MNNNPFIDAFKTVLKIVLIVMLVSFLLLLIIGYWDIKNLMINLAKLLGTIGTLSALVVFIYFAFLERFLAERNRDKTAEVCVENYGLTNQVSGKPRSGKDSSTIGEARLINRLELEKDLEELEKLRTILYIYDFDKIHEYLDTYGENFLVSGKNRLLRKYFLALARNNSFLKDHYILKKLINPKVHAFEYLNKRNKQVFEYHMDDGITPGGMPFQELLFKYFVLYTYRIFITNYIMSNQPILEQFDIEDSGKINFNFSKQFSQKFIRIKEDNPIPLPLRGVIIETEMAIMLSNVDDKNQAAAKVLNGIREFYTVIGHILGERIYMFAIVQDPHRQIKIVRELYQTYIHVFKQSAVATAPMRRKVIDIYKTQLKFTRFTYRLFGKLTRAKSSMNKFYSKQIVKVTENIAKASMLQEKLYNNGYLVTYKGVYSNYVDVGKKVKFPRFGVKIEAQNEQIIYPAFGFKSYIRISDSWGRYNTHFVHFLRDSKEDRHKMHYNDVPNWTAFDMVDDDAKFIDYAPLNEMIEGVVKETESKETPKKEKVKLTVPDYTVLSQKELLSVCRDFGFKLMSWNEIVGQKFYETLGSTIDGSNFNRLYKSEIRVLLDKIKTDYPEIDFITYPEWKQQIVKFLENEWKKAFAAK